MAQSVEHVIGNDEVISSNLITSSKKALRMQCFFDAILRAAKDYDVYITSFNENPKLSLYKTSESPSSPLLFPEKMLDKKIP